MKHMNQSKTPSPTFTYGDIVSYRRKEDGRWKRYCGVVGIVDGQWHLNLIVLPNGNAEWHWVDLERVRGFVKEGQL